jgi:hypothetical protein
VKKSQRLQLFCSAAAPGGLGYQTLSLLLCLVTAGRFKPGLIFTIRPTSLASATPKGSTRPGSKHYLNRLGLKWGAATNTLAYHHEFCSTGPRENLLCRMAQYACPPLNCNLFCIKYLLQSKHTTPGRF